jgi:hypothetical protein
MKTSISVDIAEWPELPPVGVGATAKPYCAYRY